MSLSRPAPSEREEIFIAAALRRSADLLRRDPELTTLLSSDPYVVCAGLTALRQLNLLTGQKFCDWGSGIGMVAGLAALQGFDAVGIEIEPMFVAEARALCDELSVPARFASGSFVSGDTVGSFAVTGVYGATRWQWSPEQDAYQALGTHPSETDLVYAYPWPREIGLYERLFDLTAHPGAVLWLYLHGAPPRVMIKD